MSLSLLVFADKEDDVQEREKAIVELVRFLKLSMLVINDNAASGTFLGNYMPHWGDTVEELLYDLGNKQSEEMLIVHKPKSWGQNRTRPPKCNNNLVKRGCLYEAGATEFNALPTEVSHSRI